MLLIATILPLAVWTGTARVEVMIWEPGGEHPYTTDFEIGYAETTRATTTDAGSGTVADGIVELIPIRIVIQVRHEVRDAHGQPICRGGGEEVVNDAPRGRLVPSTRSYQLVLPRAVGAFACGSRVNAGNRWVVIGSGLFHAQGDVHAADTEVRRLGSSGSRMRGEYRFSDASQGRPVRHDYRVSWDLHRSTEP